MNRKREIICSVAIATFKRPALLQDLIKSLYNQKGVENIFLDIIIVDNDYNKSAKKIVENFINNKNISIYYYCQPKQNISITRNLALEKSKGEFIAIIDDDEIADPYWIKNLIDSALMYNADAVFGFVEAIFPANAPKWIKQREIYFKPMGNTGDKPLYRYTTNCLIKSDFIKKHNIRFDEAYGLSGGEDGFFFDEMAKHNAKFIVCREAISYEVVPEYRTKLSFIYHRFFQRGNNYSLNFIKTKNNRFFKAWIYLFFKSTIALIIYGFLLMILSPIKRKWIFSFINFSLNLGKFSGLFGIKKELYRHEHSLFGKDKV